MLDAGDATFGAALRSIRQEQGLTQVQLADLAGTTPKQICRWETGDRAPSLPSLRALVAALEVPADRLLEGEQH